MPNMEEYCVLHPMEKDPVDGEIEIYFTMEKENHVKLLLLDEDLNDFKDIAEQTYEVGGNIVRFDTASVSNGIYYYCLLTKNQKTFKKMRIEN